MKDQIVETTLLAALAASRALDGCNVVASMRWGVATLSGTVDDHHTKQIAEDLARSVYGVMTVRNELSVNPEWGDEHGPPSTEFGRERDAAAVTSTRFKLADSF